MLDVRNFVHNNFSYVIDKGDELSVDCPFCIHRYGKYDGQQKLQISANNRKQVCHCWRCDYASNWVTLVRDVTGLSYIQAMGLLYVVPKPVLSESDVRAHLYKNDVFVEPVLYDDSLVMPVGFRLLTDVRGNCLELNHIKNYLRRRRFDETYWDKYQLGWVSNSWRVYIPIEGDFWQARSTLSWVQPKYMSPDNSNAERAIFNYNALQMYDEIVVCEGAFSAMAVGDNAIALMGKNPTKTKIRRLLDTDIAKFILTLEKRAWSMLQLADALEQDGRHVEIWEYVDGKDPADGGAPNTVREYTFENRVRYLLSG